MLDDANIRKDLPMLQKTMQPHPPVYLDSGATTSEPRQVTDMVVNYYESYGVNAYRGDYDPSYFADQEYEQTRKDVATLLYAADAWEIVYTSGANSVLNPMAYGYGRKSLQRGDIILTSVAEHAPCALPWVRVAQECGAVVQCVLLDAQGRIILKAVVSMMNECVRVVALVHIGNVLGYLAPMCEVYELAYRCGAVVVVDGAQSVLHIPLDVVVMDCDSLAFSAYKICGPTGIGTFYGELELLDVTDPPYLGGDSNACFDVCGNIQLKNTPYRFESDTQPIEGIFGLHVALQHIQSIGRKNIHAWEMELHDYAIRELRRLDNIEVYNPDVDMGIVTFSVKNVFVQNAATFLNTNGIAVCNGQHCAKLLNNIPDTSATIRASSYLYTPYADVDRFLDVCCRATMEVCLDVSFQEVVKASDLMKDPMISCSIIMDYYGYPRNHEPTKEDDYVQEHMVSESCIDDIHVQSRMRDGVVEDVCSDGVACTISTASTSIMSELLKGKCVGKAKDIIVNYFHMINQRDYDEEKLEEVMAFHNVGSQASRIKCVTTGWKVMEEMIEESEERHE